MAHWRDRAIDPNHPHGDDYWYRRGCRCRECSQWRRDDYRKTADFYKARRAIQGVNVYVPATGTIRRLRALACMGWSAQQIADRTGYSEIHISRTRRGVNGDDVTMKFHHDVKRIYDELEATRNDTWHGRKSMAVARRNGWAPPHAWDDIDNRYERPKGVAA